MFERRSKAGPNEGTTGDATRQSSTPDDRLERAAGTPRERFGVYVHFPYCLKKCPYCDFASFTTAREEIPHERYRDAVIAELRLRLAARASWPRVTSVFFGGGTPSLWRADALGGVLDAIQGELGFGADVEITAECNPTSLDEAHAAALLAAGVNRLSIGIQSLDDRRLEFLGRLHDVELGLAAVRAAQAAGVTRLSCDLIFGVEGGKRQRAEDARREVLALTDAGLTHLSAYGLTIEPNTKFGELAKKGRLPIAADDDLADAFFAIDEALTARGLRHYEISNYAKPGEEARHNLSYWRGDDVLGLGSSAVGLVTDHDEGGAPRATATRTKNVPGPARYMDAALAGRLEHAEVETLDAETRVREALMLGLRLEDGLDVGELGARYGVEVLTAERRRAIARLARAGRLVHDGDRLVVPRAARVFTDGVAAELF